MASRAKASVREIYDNLINCLSSIDLKSSTAFHSPVVMLVDTRSIGVEMLKDVAEMYVDPANWKSEIHPPVLFVPFDRLNTEEIFHLHVQEV